MCRELGYFNLGDIHTAVCEYNGKLTVLPKSSRRPATPEDLHLSPAQGTFFTEIIMDGCILDANLMQIGRDVRWLQKQLKAQGYASVEEIYPGLCDTERNLTLYPCIP